MIKYSIKPVIFMPKAEAEKDEKCQPSRGFAPELGRYNYNVTAHESASYRHLIPWPPDLAMELLAKDEPWTAFGYMNKPIYDMYEHHRHVAECISTWMSFCLINVSRVPWTIFAGGCFASLKNIADFFDDLHMKLHGTPWVAAPILKNFREVKVLSSCSAALKLTVWQTKIRLVIYGMTERLVFTMTQKDRLAHQPDYYQLMTTLYMDFKRKAEWIAQLCFLAASDVLEGTNHIETLGMTKEFISTT